MIPAKKDHPTDVPTWPIEKVARLIQTFNRQEKARLLQLVPDLQTIRPDEADIPAEQVELMAYFQDKIEALPAEAEPWLDEEVFLENLTMSEFFALPEAEQDRLWQAAHQAVEWEILSAGQKWLKN